MTTDGSHLQDRVQDQELGGEGRRRGQPRRHDHDDGGGQEVPRAFRRPAARRRRASSLAGDRSEELETINKAFDIIGGGAVSGSAEKHRPAMVQTGALLAQLRVGMESRCARVAALLRSRAKLLSSLVLMAAAERADGDAFGKVKKMIQDLIVRLMEEANEEAEHKGSCDTELATNEKARKREGAQGEDRGGLGDAEGRRRHSAGGGHRDRELSGQGGSAGLQSVQGVPLG
eukprot:10772760-Heterocapsa_arctica.AAC.1